MNHLSYDAWLVIGNEKYFTCTDLKCLDEICYHHHMSLQHDVSTFREHETEQTED